uniref:NADH dehydrogenase subunit 6 n=1 Tax=Conostigmus sp. MM-2013 TaxID=1357450 RepID=V9NJA2_9HYME|nr:NADH dehydrogenase subunit 6 [Conostigmus sp. MM-2013]
MNLTNNLNLINNYNNLMIFMNLMNFMLIFLWIIPLNSFLTPLTMFCSLLMFSMITALSTSWWMNINWYPMMIMLMMIGGLMISFMYMLSISPNEMKIKMNFINLNWFFSLNFIFLIIFMNDYFKTINFNKHELMKINNYEFFISKYMYMYPLNIISMFTIIYLFYCLIIMVKIINFFNKPMKTYN